MRTRVTQRMAIACGALALLLLAGCGERPQVLVFRQGNYQGKPDTAPFAVAPWNGDRAKWERELRNRTLYQNEYRRIGT